MGAAALGLRPSPVKPPVLVASVVRPVSRQLCPSPVRVAVRLSLRPVPRPVLGLSPVRVLQVSLLLHHGWNFSFLNTNVTIVSSGRTVSCSGRSSHAGPHYCQ